MPAYPSSVQDTQTGSEVAEPVHESAPLARWIAERVCRVDPGTGESCAWYHGFRQYLRVLGLAVTPSHHADFLREAMAGAVERGQRVRVLISGAIDYSMFAHVLWACRESGVSPAVTIVDVCDTPLFLNLWYAQRIGLSVRTVRSDILAYMPPTVSISSAPMPSSASSPRIGGRNSWPGGIPCSHRAEGSSLWHPSAQTAALDQSASLPARRRRSAKQCAQVPGSMRGISISVRTNWRGSPTLSPPACGCIPVHSLQDLRTLFEKAPFSLEHLSISSVKHRGAELSGPTVSRSADHALVVARR